MSLLTILEFPDTRLRTIAEPVTEFNASLKTLIEDMFETMYAAKGIGLAATQVNVHQRVVVMDLSDDQSEKHVFINPSIEVLDADLDEMQEGCLSVPGFYETVKRPKRVNVHFQDADGQAQTLEASELLSVCIQHELDHLNGKLFVDYLSSLKRSRIRSKLEKQHKEEMLARAK